MKISKEEFLFTCHPLEHILLDELLLGEVLCAFCALF